jgi:hypothetical protein
MIRMTTTEQTRAAPISERAVANSDGTITFSLSSEYPVERYDGTEVLVHESGAVDLSFLASGNAPLLDAHERWSMRNQIGVITDAWIEDRRIYVTAKFSSADAAQSIRQDVLDDVVRNVSIGYNVMRIERDETSNTNRVVRWRPYEASFVPVPADPTVGIGRSLQPTKEGSVMTTKPTDTPAAPPPMTDEHRAEVMTTAINDITALGSAHNAGDLARAFIAGAMQRGDIPSLATFKGVVAAKLPEGVPLVTNDVGLSQRETQRFSLRKFLLATSAGATRAEQDAAGFEMKAVEAAGQGRNGAFVLPDEVTRSWNTFEVDGLSSMDPVVRAVIASRVTDPRIRAALGASGNANVQDTAHLASQFIYNLRNRLVLGRLGLTMLTGLEGNIEIPGGNANIAAAWLGSEDANAAESNPSFRKISMAIKDVAVYTDMTRRMLIQSTIDVEAYVRMQIMEAMAQAIDTAGFYGTGSSGQPTGLTGTSGIGSVEFAAEFPVRDEVIDMFTAIATANQTAMPVFVGNAEMQGALMKEAIDAGSGRFLMERVGQIATGHTYEMTNQITSGDLIAGVFSDMIMGTWGSLELDRSTEAKFLSGGLRLRAIQSVDFGVRRTGSFVLGNDGV